MWWLGVLIELIAVFCSALGKVLLRLAAVRSQPWFYVVGVLIAAVISPIFDLMAYGFAPTTLLTACGGMVVVFNVVLCPCILNERLTMQRALSAFLITVGTVGSSLFGSHDQTEQSQEDYMRLFVRPWSIVYYGLLLSWYALCVVLIRTSKDKEVQSAWLAALGGSCAGNSFTTKAGVEMLTCYEGSRTYGCHSDPLGEPFFWAMCIGTLLWHGGGFFILAIALRVLPALYAVTIYEGTLIISGALSGAMVLAEMAGRPVFYLVLYGVSMLLILSGLGILARWPFEDYCSAEVECTAACIRSCLLGRGCHDVPVQDTAVDGEPAATSDRPALNPISLRTSTEKSRLVSP